MTLFQGELMICMNCGRQQRSEPDFESQWTAAQLDGLLIYFCPKCWGIPDPAPSRCKLVGHRWHGTVCQRCGKKRLVARG